MIDLVLSRKVDKVVDLVMSYSKPCSQDLGQQLK